jgi:aminopeptidase
MMADPRIRRLAEVLCSYSVGVKEGELIVIEGASVAAPLVRELYAAVVRAGGHPQVRVALDGVAEARYGLSSDDQLDWVNPVRVEEVERADGRIAILASTNTRALSGADPARQARVSRAYSELQSRILERSAAGEYRWVVSAFPTQAAAQEARMSLEDYTDFLFASGFLDREDPVAAWQELGDRLRRLAEWLGRKRELRIVGDGTDLTLSVEGRTWIPCDGLQNFPDGELFTAPVESSVDGEIRFTFPAVFHHRAVEDVRLRFRGGEVVEASAGKGQSFLEEMVAMDEGARRVGEFSFGLNDAVQTFTGEALFDEKIGGTVHLALGEAYPESGGVNASALHWDMVCDLRRGGEVYADGELVYRDGRFLGGRF